MLTQSQIDAIAEAVIQSMKPAPAPEEKRRMHRTTEIKKDRPVEASEVVPMDASFMMEKSPAEKVSQKNGLADNEGLIDITSPEVKAIPLLDHVEDREGLERMIARTPARIGVGQLRTAVKDTDHADPSCRSCGGQRRGIYGCQSGAFGQNESFYSGDPVHG